MFLVTAYCYITSIRVTVVSEYLIQNNQTVKMCSPQESHNEKQKVEAKKWLQW